MLNDWISCNDDICGDNYNYFQFKLKGKRRSAGGAATQYFAKVVDFPFVQLHRCCSWREGMSFWAVYTGTRPWVAPTIRVGKGWRGRRELAPRCSATQLGASQARPWPDTARSSSSEPHTHHKARTGLCHLCCVTSWSSLAGGHGCLRRERCNAAQAASAALVAVDSCSSGNSSSPLCATSCPEEAGVGRC